MLSLTPSVQSPRAWWQNAPDALIQQRVTQAVIAEVLYPLTDPEDAAGVVPVDFHYQPGDVRRYGSNDDPGTTDMTAAVQAALDQHAQGGAAVVLVGNCMISAPLAVSFTGDFSLYGIGAAKLTSTITDDGSSASILELAGGADSHVVLRDFVVAHSGTDDETLFGINVSSQVRRLVTEGVEVTGVPYYGVQFLADDHVHAALRLSGCHHAGGYFGGGSCVLVGCAAVDNGNGVDNTTGYGVVVSCTNSKIVGGRFVDNDRYNIDGRRADNFTVDGAYCYNAGYIGIYAVNEDNEKDAKNIKIVNCTVDQNARAGSDHAVWVGAFGANTVSPGEIHVCGNTIQSPLGNGVIVGSGSGGAAAKTVNVSDNHFDSVAGSYSVAVTGTDEVTSATVCRNQMVDSPDVLVSAVSLAIVCDNAWANSSSGDRAVGIGADAAVVRGNVYSGTLTSAAIEGTATNWQVGENWWGVADPSTHTGGGALSLATRVTHFVSDNAANALTLADGWYEGHEKIIVHTVDGGSGVLTPANMLGGTTITFTNAGDSAVLRFVGGKWVMVAGNAVVA